MQELREKKELLKANKASLRKLTKCIKEKKVPEISVNFGGGNTFLLPNSFNETVLDAFITAYKKDIIRLYIEIQQL